MADSNHISLVCIGGNHGMVVRVALTVHGDDVDMTVSPLRIYNRYSSRDFSSSLLLSLSGDHKWSVNAFDKSGARSRVDWLRCRASLPCPSPTD